MELKFKINPISITYNDISEVVVSKISSPFKIDNDWFFLVLMQLRREGEYEAKEIETRNLTVPIQYSPIFERILIGQESEEDRLLVNGLVSSINSDIVIIWDTSEYSEEVIIPEPEEETPIDEEEETPTE